VKHKFTFQKLGNTILNIIIICTDKRISFDKAEF